MNETKKVVMLCVDDSDVCEEAMKWSAEHVCRPGDEVHMIHVIPRLQAMTKIGASPVDVMPYTDPGVYDDMISSAEGMLEKRALAYFDGEEREPIVHLIKYETDNESIGELICRKAKELKANLVVVAKHNQGALSELFLGSVTTYCVKHCTVPCLVYR